MWPKALRLDGSIRDPNALHMMMLEHVRRPLTAMEEAWKALRSDGLCVISSHQNMVVHGHPHDYWRFTTASCSTLFAEAFGPEHVAVQSHGNVLAAIAFLTGIAHEELARRDLERNDPYFPLIITVRAVKLDPIAGDVVA